MEKGASAVKMYSAIFLLTLLSICSGQQVDKNDICGAMKIKCTCGIGENRRDLFLELEQQMIPDALTGVMKCALIPDPYQACGNYSCALAADSGLRLTDGVSGIQPGQFVASIFPQEFTIPSGGFPEGNRFTRDAGPCHVMPLNYATIKCWKWPNWMNCDIICNHAHALQRPKDTYTVKTTNINCRLTENVWKPHGFIDCKPYVNCKAHLVKPGDLKCQHPLDAPAYCEISCLDYEDHEATSLKTYECNDESFRRSLPHCAVLQDNVELVRKPK